MSIVKMKKFSLLVLEEKREELLKRLQIFGDVHIRNLAETDNPDIRELSRFTSDESLNRAQNDLTNVGLSIKKLEKYADEPGGLKAMMTPLPDYSYDELDTFPATFDHKAIYDEIKQNEEEVAFAKSETLRLNQENDGLRGWQGFDVSIDELDALRTVKYLFGVVGKNEDDTFTAAIKNGPANLHIELAARLKDDMVYLAIMPADEFDETAAFLRSAGFLRTTVPYREKPAVVLAANEEKLKELKTVSQNADANYIRLAKDLGKLKVVYDYCQTLYDRESSVKKLRRTGRTVLLEGWCPADDTGKMNDVISSICAQEYFLEMKDVPADDTEVPIKLQNKLFKAFESIVEMFALPLYNEIDPTPLFAPFYMVAFGLMIADTGFGLLLVVATGIILKFFRLTEGGRNFMKLFFMLGISTAFCGLLFGSFFSFSFPKPYKALIDLEGGGIMVLMILSLVFGIVQLIFGLFIKGFILARNGRIDHAVYDAGFTILAVLSAIGWILGGALGLSPSAVTIAKYLFLAAIVGMTLTQGRDAVTVGGKLASGLYNVYGLSAYLGDFISFTRIAALMLSGNYIGASFIKIAEMFKDTPAAYYTFGVLIIIVGQALNLGLGLLGAYVHTSRLQFVEYFGKFYDGGGVKYAPLTLKSKYINIKE